LSEEYSSYLDELYGGRYEQDFRDRLDSERLARPEVVADEYKRAGCSGDICARQFSFNLKWVREMLRHMYERYNWVTVYSMGMLDIGDIVYYLCPFTVGLHQDVEGYNVASIGGPDCTARVQLKGRFGIVVSKSFQNIKVAQMYTFNGKGLAQAKPQHMWREYVGIRETGVRNYQNPSPHKELEVGKTCVDIDANTSVYLITDKISLTSQSMISGRITDESLKRLRRMISKVDV
jgi:hypothetical protein